MNGGIKEQCPSLEITEDEMVGWHHQLDGHESEQILGSSRDRRGWCAAVHGVTKTRLSD